VRTTLRRLPLAGGISLAIPATILALALGSNWSPSVRSVAGPLRWVGLFCVCVLALGLAIERGRPWRAIGLPGAAAAAFVAVAFVSALWSVDPRLTAARAVSFVVLLVAASALSLAAAGDRALGRRILGAVLAGAVLVALAGIGVYLVRHGRAVQAATTQNPVRFRGIGQNPNTVAMLLAVALPLAALLGLEARTWARRLAAALAFLVLFGSIVASGSRGALLAGFAAILFLGLAWARDLRSRTAIAVGAAALFAIGVGITRIPNPLSPSDPQAHKSASAYAAPYNAHDAERFWRLEDDVGRPAGGSYRPPKHRTLLGGSGRIDAWRAGFHQGDDRPLLGYGFGTEDHVFVDRLYDFEGGTAENSFVGLFMQLGGAGLALFLLLVAGLLAAGWRAVRGAADRGLAAACFAVLLVGLALAVVQSYVYSVGNTATMSIWICAFLPVAAGAR
jgi:O-Antigen ligase